LFKESLQGATSLSLRDIGRGVVSNALWDLIKKVLGLVSGGLVFAAASWTIDKMRHVGTDYVAIVVMFVVGLGLMYLAMRIQRRLEAPSVLIPAPTDPSSKQISFLDLMPECSRSDEKWTHKSKIRVVLRNDTQEMWMVSEPRWNAGPGGVKAQEPFGYALQVEGPHGWENNDWRPESTNSVQVPAGCALRLWIGLQLDPSIPVGDRMVEILQRAVRKRLGVLSLKLTKPGTVQTWRRQL
jgi:hypothetical protein